MKYLIIFSLFAALMSVACGNASNTNAIANNANKAVVNSANVGNSPTASPTPDTNTSAGSLATPTDAYKTAYALREKKDLEGLKKIMADDVKEFLTEIGKAEKKSLDDMIKDMFLKPQAKSDESRDEKIDGSHATLEYPDEKGAWKTMDFQKVGDKWLMSLPKMDKNIK